MVPLVLNEAVFDSHAEIEQDQVSRRPSNEGGSGKALLESAGPCSPVERGMPLPHLAYDSKRNPRNASHGRREWGDTQEPQLGNVIQRDKDTG
jgi:hypothetical protein